MRGLAAAVLAVENREMRTYRTPVCDWLKLMVNQIRMWQ